MVVYLVSWFVFVAEWAHEEEGIFGVEVFYCVGAMDFVVV